MSTARKQYWAKRIVFPVAVVSYRLTSLLRRIRTTLFHQREGVIGWLSQGPAPIGPRPRVLAGIVHVTAPIGGYEPRSLEVKIERVRKAIDGLLSSFSHCDLEIVLVTYRDQNVIDRLPDYQQQRIRIVTHESGDPLYMGFHVQDVFFEERDKHDWFLFTEDDLVLHDSTFLDKLSRFNAAIGHDKIVLVPNRYEYVAGAKTYIDLYKRSQGEDFVFDLASGRTIDGLVFAENANPHTGLYCLSRKQLDRWDRSGRHWYNKSNFVGPLESAATGCLYECFVLYKPGPTNLHFVEIEHLDDKYTKAIHELRAAAAASSVG